VRVDLFDYELPQERIAKRPAEHREDARVLVVPPEGDVVDSVIRDWPDRIPAGSLVVLNDTKVVKARLVGHKEATGGRVEMLLVRRTSGGQSEQTWEALCKGMQPFRRGLRVTFGGPLSGELVEKPGDGGLALVRIFTNDGSKVSSAVEAEGKMPLPPYVRREPDEKDVERYQTVYARAPGAIAAPTAGLHLTESALALLGRRGVRVASLTLHVGLGTFQPVTVDDLDRHPMHAEWVDVSPALAAEIDEARARGGSIVAVGTTVVRALESTADPRRPGSILPFSGETRILLQPGHSFRVVDALLTNFHLPRSTLVALVAAFIGRERLLWAYGQAVRRGYRFYSYGDAMWIPSRASGVGP
jgi:S-adenosylmethionine:tRNA ribosyltransferase-isomerase